MKASSDDRRAMRATHYLPQRGNRGYTRAPELAPAMHPLPAHHRGHPGGREPAVKRAPGITRPAGSGCSRTDRWVPTRPGTPWCRSSRAPSGHARIGTPPVPDGRDRRAPGARDGRSPSTRRRRSGTRRTPGSAAIVRRTADRAGSPTGPGPGTTRTRIPGLAPVDVGAPDSADPADAIDDGEQADPGEAVGLGVGDAENRRRLSDRHQCGHEITTS